MTGVAVGIDGGGRIGIASRIGEARIAEGSLSFSALVTFAAVQDLGAAGGVQAMGAMSANARRDAGQRSLERQVASELHDVSFMERGERAEDLDRATHRLAHRLLERPEEVVAGIRERVAAERGEREAADRMLLAPEASLDQEQRIATG